MAEYNMHDDWAVNLCKTKKGPVVCLLPIFILAIIPAAYALCPEPS